MGIKEEIFSINIEDLNWEQKKIKQIISKLKDYSDIREKLEVSLIHIKNAFKNPANIDKSELENAKKDINELKSSSDLDILIAKEAKKGFFASFSGLFRKTVVATAVAGVTLGAVNTDAKTIPHQPVAQVQQTNTIQTQINKIGAEIEIGHYKEARKKASNLSEILEKELKKANNPLRQKAINNCLLNVYRANVIAYTSEFEDISKKGIKPASKDVKIAKESLIKSLRQFPNDIILRTQQGKLAVFR